MKKTFQFAVAVVMTALCAVFTACTPEYDFDTQNGGGIVEVKKSIEELSCKPVSTTFGASGIVVNQTRAAIDESEYTGTPDGLFTATTKFEKTFLYAQPGDSIQTYLGVNTLQAYGIISKARHIRDIDNIKNSKPQLGSTSISKGKLWLVQNPDGEDHNMDYSFLEGAEYGDDLEVFDPKTEQMVSFEKCTVYWKSLNFRSRSIEDGQRDSLKWHLWMVTDAYQPVLSNEKEGVFAVTYPVWEWTGSGDPEYPDDEFEVICYTDEDKGLDYVDPNTSLAWINIQEVLSNGKNRPYRQVSVELTNAMTSPEAQEKTVDDFDWEAQKPALYEENTNGDSFEKKDSIWVTPLIQSAVAKTNKGICSYVLNKEGRAYWLDPKGEKHFFLEGYWSLDTDEWNGLEKPATENFENYQLTNDISLLFNEHEHVGQGIVNLKKIKGGNSNLIDYEYSDLNSDESGIRLISPIAKYWSFRTQYAVFSNGKKEKLGEVGTYVGASVVVPAKQVFDVEDWNISDSQALWYGEQRQAVRRDTVETGIFTITPWKKYFVTKTNVSSARFEILWDSTVVFKDNFNNEVKFLTVNPKPVDKGGVATLKELPVQNDKERKEMTTTMALTVTGLEQAQEYTATVEFQKDAPQEKLLEQPTVETDYRYDGNGVWTSWGIITYKWALQGTTTKKVEQSFKWTVTGEAKKSVKADVAELNYDQLIAGSVNGPKVSHPQQGVTVNTTTQSFTDSYDILNDVFTTTTETGFYEETVDGYTVKFDFMVPSSLTLDHDNGTLTDGNRTTTEKGTTYNVYDHNGSVKATVVSSKGNQTETATDVKDVLVEKVIIPSNPEWGEFIGIPTVDGKLTATLVYWPNVGDKKNGAFACNFILKFKNGLLPVTTVTYANEGNHWHPEGYGFAVGNFYKFGSAYRGMTLTENNFVNSVVQRNGQWELASLTYQVGGWVYEGIGNDEFYINMPWQLAVNIGIKNFNGDTTAENNPYLNYSYRVDNGILRVFTAKGAPVFSMKVSE